MTTLFNDSSIPSRFALSIAEKSNNATVAYPEQVHLIIGVCLQAMADYAKVVKAKDKPVAVTIEDLKGNIIFGLKVIYIAGSSDAEEGAWVPSWSFNAEDFADCTIYSVSESKSNSFFINRGDTIRMTFNTPASIYVSCYTFATQLKDWLIENVNVSKKEVEVELPAYFRAGASLEGDEVILTFDGEEELNNLVKDDATLQAAD